MCGDRERALLVRYRLLLAGDSFLLEFNGELRRHML